jgi:CubicO group peptidase (beta-lactamase class C family)
LNGRELDAALDAPLKKKLPLHGVLVMRHGYIVKEKYFDAYDVGTPHELYSCTKSFVSALAAIAIQKGYLTDLAAPVLSFFPDKDVARRDARKEAMTIEDLLTMRSGLSWEDGDSTYKEMYKSSRDWVKYVLDLPMSTDPGTRFLYSSGNSIVLSAIIQRASGKDTYDFARETLFEPLGIHAPPLESGSVRPSHRRLGIAAHAARDGEARLPVSS